MSGGPDGVAVAVARRLEWVFAQVGRLESIALAAFVGGPPRRDELGLESVCRALLSQRELPLAGAGFVAAPGALRDAAYWLEWWVADPAVGESSVRRLAAETDPGAVGFRDYTELAWWTGPVGTGADWVTGPYVDYVCTDQHTLTCTRPVYSEGELVGVVGVDLLAATVESVLGPALAADGECIVVNASGRVVAASDPTWVAGDLVRRSPWPGGGEIPCAGTPLRVLHP